MNEMIWAIGAGITLCFSLATVGYKWHKEYTLMDDVIVYYLIMICMLLSAGWFVVVPLIIILLVLRYCVVYPFKKLFDKKLDRRRDG